jgi:hypothetical protein
MVWSSVLRLLFAKPVLHTFQRRQRRRVVKTTFLPRLQAGDPHPLVSVHAAPATATAAQVHELHLSALGALVCGGASGIASSLATERRSLPLQNRPRACIRAYAPSGVCKCSSARPLCHVRLPCVVVYVAATLHLWLPLGKACGYRWAKQLWLPLAKAALGRSRSTSSESDSSSPAPTECNQSDLAPAGN